MPPGRGVALAEVIVAAIILAIGLTVVISISTRALGMQSDGERRITAAWLADELLNLVLADGPEEFPRINDLAGQFGDPFDEYEYEIMIEDQGLGQPFQVTSIVSWPGPGGLRWVELQTLVAERKGDPYQPREPYEVVDREARYFGEDEELE